MEKTIAGGGREVAPRRARRRNGERDGRRVEVDGRDIIHGDVASAWPFSRLCTNGSVVVGGQSKELRDKER